MSSSDEDPFRLSWGKRNQARPDPARPTARIDLEPKLFQLEVWRSPAAWDEEESTLS
ncbi:hypothetical protein PGTUg99_025246 [Puccinia graminis f. sp. tritici]|uniref:Uncharacterized protein n=1 Tax=Puccinia graminis f. sp. tritici TaxID=56615 RepID=A0A5B0RT71_PUCGR|nr:hypothetical protein PGTUg99_025246 [Puccinia graminis f. sp. tritici]